MDRGDRAGACVGGGERIPTLRPARRARITIALVAAALVAAMGALVATDAGASTELALVGTAVSELTLALAFVAGWSGSIQWSVGLLAMLFLLRHEDRIALAPIYGAGLLLVGELAQRAIDLRGVQRISPGVIRARLAAVIVLAALGACGGAIATIAVRIAPVRSVGFTASGTIAALATVAALTRLSRRRVAGGERHTRVGRR